MQDRLEEVSFSRILAVKQLQELEDEFLIDDFFPDAWLEIRRLQESQKEFIHQLKVSKSTIV